LEIPEQEKEKFAGKEILCEEYSGLAPGTDREIFQRVQLGVSLTVAEKLQAIASPWAEWISDLEIKHVSVEEGLAHVLQWDTKRGRDFQNIAHLVYCCDGLPDEYVPTGYQKIEKWLSRVDPPGQQFKADIEDVLTDLWIMATDEHLNDAFVKVGKQLAPVEFVFIGVLLYVLRRATPEQRARAIYNLRIGIRAQFKDVRMNTGVVAAMWRMIDRLRIDPTGPVVAAGHSVQTPKRKRKADEDDEYRPSPIKSLGKTPKTRSKREKYS